LLLEVALVAKAAVPVVAEASVSPATKPLTEPLRPDGVVP